MRQPSSTGGMRLAASSLASSLEECAAHYRIRVFFGTSGDGQRDANVPRNLLEFHTPKILGEFAKAVRERVMRPLAPSCEFRP